MTAQETHSYENHMTYYCLHNSQHIHYCLVCTVPALPMRGKKRTSLIKGKEYDLTKNGS